MFSSLRNTWYCLLTLAAAWWGFAHAAVAADAAHPNILFFLTDDQRFDHMGCAGDPVVQTPNMDRLAARGTRFTNAFVTTPICAASRATMFTGLYERTHKYTFRTPPLAQSMTDNSYPVLLRHAGYRTGFVGKFGVGVQPGVTQAMFDVFRPLNRSPYLKRQPDGSLRHTIELTGDHAVEFLRGQPRDQAFCLALCFNAPHAEDADMQAQYPSPKAVVGLYEDLTIADPPLSDPAIFARHPDFLKRSLNRQRWYWRWDTPDKYQKNVKAYYRMITGIDRVMGRVLAELTDLGMAENTVVIFASDNGYYRGSRGFAGKWSHYEESLRIPMIIDDPRLPKSQRGKTNASMVLNVDIPATILDIAGATQPKSYQGSSLCPLLAGPPPSHWRTDFFCEHLMHYPEGLPKWEGVRDQRWVYARYFEEEPTFEFLHDLQTDPQQLQNLIADPKSSAALDRMRRRCDQLRDQYGGPYSPEKYPLAQAATPKLKPKAKANPKKSKQHTSTTSPSKPPAQTKGKTRVKPGQRKAGNGKADRPPNVLYIISDDQAWTDFGFMGHPIIETPHLDRLAAQSARFTRGYVPTALCRPSLMTLITGLYAHQHGVTGNDPLLAGQQRPDRSKPEYLAKCSELISKIDALPTLPKLLAQRGYVSFQSGKWWEGNYRRGGFTDGMTHGDPKRGGRHGDEGLKIGRKGLKPIFDFIDSAGDKPFMVWYAPFLPHSPHNPPQRLLEKYTSADRPIELARYYAMCEWFDETCGELLGYLDQHGLRDNTLVVFVVDNGWIQRTPQTDAPTKWKYGFAPRSKQTAYEGGVRTPILLQWPKHIRPRRIQQPISSIDLVPTILAACGAETPPRLPGQNLLDVCRGRVAARDAVFGEAFAHDIADINDPTKTLLNTWCVEGRWKLLLHEDGAVNRYVTVHGSRPVEPLLYDLLADPHETINRAELYPEVVDRLRQRIQQWWPRGS